MLPVGPLYLRDRSVHGFAISHADTAQLADAARGINGLLASGLLASARHEVLPLSEAAEAHRRLDEGKVHGKLVLHVRD
ncbi:hypothetical protein GCM10023238_36770 [Streptomyces heliomycini]